VADAGT
jgi:hypothetical protein